MAVENIAFSQNTLSCIIRALADLQRLGGSANDDLWLLGKSHANATKPPESDTALRPELLDVLTTMKCIEEMKFIFHELARSCERKLRSLKKELRPSFMHFGIQMIPDEVLRRIFDLLVHDNKVASPTGPEVTLSHVSSRFRSVCLNTRSLWARLDTRMSKLWIEAYLKRSRGSPLTVVVHEPLSESEESYKLISSCAPRWRSLQLAKLVGRSVRFHVSDVGSEYLRKLCLPELKYLTVDREVGHEYIENLGKWDMPKLSHVFLDGVWLTKGIRNMCFDCEKIRSFNFRPCCGSVVEFSKHSAVLGSLPNLTELQMVIWIEGSDHSVTLPEVTLPKVEYFSLKIMLGDEADLSIKHLHMPRLAKFKLEIEADNSNYLGVKDWIGTWKDFVPSGERVTDFTLIDEIKDRTEKFCIGDIVLSFPVLQTLVLMNWYHDLVLDDRCSPDKNIAMPPLRTLSILHASFDFLAEFALAMRQSGTWDVFESLHVERSRLLSKQVMDNLISTKGYDDLEDDD